VVKVGQEIKYVVAEWERYAIISLDEFKEMQSKIKQHQESQSKTITKNNKFWLKGHLFDNEGRRMSASTSKGRSKKYSYYHTNQKGAANIPVDTAHSMIINLFKHIKLKPNVITYIEQEVIKYIDKEQKDKKVQKTVIKTQISKAETRIQELNKMFALGDLAIQEYKELKNIVESQIEKDYQKLDELNSLPDISTFFYRKMIDLIINLEKIFINQSMEGKTLLLGGFFPNGIFLDLESSRVGTTYLNNFLAQLIDMVQITKVLKIETDTRINECRSRVENPLFLESTQRDILLLNRVFETLKIA
jgi:hypothetical protein